MTFIQNYDQFLEVFNPFLDRYLSSLRKTSDNMHDSAQLLIDISSQAVNSSGKRLRPYLVALGYQIASNQTNLTDEILKAGLIAEIFHSFALVHDDIIDQSDTRRGQKTSHILFAEEHNAKKFKGTDRHFGTSMAILTGDLLIAYSTKLLTDLNFDTAIKEKAHKCFTDMFINLIIGQYQDVYQSFDNERPSKEMILSTLRWKSGEYSIEFPLKFGGILGGASDNLLDFYAKFAKPVGIAFQLKDDLLGIFGDSQSIGKSNLSDIREGKNTLLINYAFAAADNEQKSVLNQILGDVSAQENELQKVRSILIETGAKDQVEEEISAMIQSTQSLIAQSEISQDHKQILSGFADYIINRNR